MTYNYYFYEVLCWNGFQFVKEYRHGFYAHVSSLDWIM